MFSAFTSKLTTTFAQISHNLDEAHAADLARKKERDGGDFTESVTTTQETRSLPEKLGIMALADVVPGVVKEAVGVRLSKPEEKTEERRPSGGAALPWEGVENEDALMKVVLALSEVRETFTSDPPAEASSAFEINEVAPVAMRLLELDPNLQKMRYELVPRSMKEPTFWRNYFYHVQLLTTQHTAAHLDQTSSTSASDKQAATTKESLPAEHAGITAPEEDSITTKAEKHEQRNNKSIAATQENAEGPTAQELREVVGLPSHLNDEASEPLEYEEFASDAYGDEWDGDSQGEVLYEASDFDDEEAGNPETAKKSQQ
ncbi:hypothetical protein HK097_002170 [Rhizophlyctis rosea]|uniref:BSD domain-containing protein n=1 Tax=Rhizophlyctis rosea TaxID=64517 RepID=A0AAD5SGP9_9FUNG|nr:hypothetical protein HK097_002170 [Rhizophlyctis rosea]